MPRPLIQLGTLAVEWAESQANFEEAKRESPAFCRALPSPYGLLRVKRVGMRLAHFDIRALRHTQRIRVVNDHMDRTHPYAAAGRAGTWWSASAIAGLFI